MSITKEECGKALSEIEYSLCELEETKTGVDVYCLFDENLEIVKRLIKEHFDPQPYKFEELEDGMWIWDDKLEICDQVILTRVCLEPKTEKTCKPFYVVTYAGEIEYEENRFFPITKANQEKEVDE